jgi:hypothetical protein
LQVLTIFFRTEWTSQLTCNGTKENSAGDGI